MRLVRLVLVDPTDEFATIYIDVFVRDDASIYDKVVTYGRWDALSGEPWPFIVQPRTGADASVDFGTGLDDEMPRFGSINIFKKRVMRGEFATFTYGDDAICYKMVKATVIPTGEDFFLLV